MDKMKIGNGVKTRIASGWDDAAKAARRRRRILRMQDFILKGVFMAEIKKNPATWAVILMNVLVFLAVEATGGSENVENMMNWGAEYAPVIQARGEYYRLFTCMFLHFGLSHLGNNMLILYFVGGHLERAAGKLCFLAVYLLGGVGGSLISYYLDIYNQTAAVSAGASGAIFAVIGGLIWVLLANRGRLEDLTLQKMAFLAALSLYFGFTSTGVDNAAHLGGFFLGFLVSLLLYRRHGKEKDKGSALSWR